MPGDTIRFGSPADLVDTGTFLARLTRFDAGAPVRLRAAGAGLALWAWLPIDVLVTRAVAAGPEPGSGHDVSVVGAELLGRVAAARDAGALLVPLPARRDDAWRGSLPAGRRVAELDAVPAAVVRGLVSAGEAAYRRAAGATRVAAATGAPDAVAGELLGHESLRVSAGGTDVAVPLRVLFGLARMGFLGEDPVRVAVDGPWLRAAASFGAAYRRRDDLPTSLRLR